MQYTESVHETIGYALDPANNFDVFVQWLNPGYKDKATYFDHLGLAPFLLAENATLSMRSGKVSPTKRSEEIRHLIHGWATAKALTF